MKNSSKPYLVVVSAFLTLLCAVSMAQLTAKQGRLIPRKSHQADTQLWISAYAAQDLCDELDRGGSDLSKSAKARLDVLRQSLQDAQKISKVSLRQSSSSASSGTRSATCTCFYDEDGAMVVRVRTCQYPGHGG
jgi:hypothetical protein